MKIRMFLTAMALVILMGQACFAESPASKDASTNIGSVYRGESEHMIPQDIDAIAVSGDGMYMHMSPEGFTTVIIVKDGAVVFADVGEGVEPLENAGKYGYNIHGGGE